MKKSNFKKYISEKKHRANYFKALKQGKKIKLRISLERLLKVLNLTNGTPLPAFMKALDDSGLLAKGTNMFVGDGMVQNIDHTTHQTIQWTANKEKSDVFCTATYPDPFNEGESKTSAIHSLTIRGYE